MHLLAIFLALVLQDPPKPAADPPKPAEPVKAPADTGEQYFKFKPGTTWSFKTKEGDTDGKLTLKVEKEDGGKVYVESTEERADRDPKIEKLVWNVDKGVLIWAEIKEEKPSTVFQLYKLGSKKGDTWDAGEAAPPGTKFEHMGANELKIAAGTYKDAIEIKGTFGEMGTVSFFLVPKVGLVKMEIKLSKGANTIELTEFVEGK